MGHGRAARVWEGGTRPGGLWVSCLLGVEGVALWEKQTDL